MLTRLDWNEKSEIMCLLPIQAINNRHRLAKIFGSTRQMWSIWMKNLSCELQNGATWTLMSKIIHKRLIDAIARKPSNSPKMIYCRKKKKMHTVTSMNKNWLLGRRLTIERKNWFKQLQMPLIKSPRKYQLKSETSVRHPTKISKRWSFAWPTLSKAIARISTLGTQLGRNCMKWWIEEWVPAIRLLMRNLQCSLPSFRQGSPPKT